MNFSFFTTDNKSGHKTREKWLNQNHEGLYNKIINHCSNINLDLSFKEKIWFYYNGLTERPKCISCQTEIKFRNRLDKPYGDFCSLICANTNKELMVERQKKSIQKKYGVDFYPNHKDFVKKQKQTKLLKYGNENFNNIEKVKETKLKLYNNENYNNIKKNKSTNLKKYGNENFSKSDEYKKQTKENYVSLYPDLNIIKVSGLDVTLICDDCKNTYVTNKQLLYERKKRNYNPCVICNPIGNGNRSEIEKQICEFLDIKNINHTTNDKIGEEQIEIDILLSDYNIGIELNGLYWHNELFKNKDFHLNKTKISNKCGISLIHIFEDEWVYKKDIVKSIILNKVLKTENKIFARQCLIKEIDSKISKSFLENNHIQGNVQSSVRLGLYYNDSLVSVMSFSKGRVLMGGKKNEWELNRFCNQINLNVVGGSSKLLSYFIKKYKPEIIISYSDIRLYGGEMYSKLGFINKSTSLPNYWYVVNGIRKHRFNYRKSILIKEGFDKTITEKQIMLNRKIYRIYDCGNVRWELKF